MPTLQIRGVLRDLTGGRAEHSVHGATVVDALRDFEGANPAASGWILDERGHIRRHINVFVDGEQGTATTPVGDDARIDVLPAISGGR